MRPTCACILLVALLAIFVSYSAAHYISDSAPPSHSNNVYEQAREKRQVETFDSEDYPTNEGVEEETGFWDRVVKIAIKLFSRFIEWLNT